MTSTDPYRLSAVDSSHGTSSAGLAWGKIVRTLVWTVLVISVVANTTASYVGASTAAHLACGVVTAACTGALVVNALRGRR